MALLCINSSVMAQTENGFQKVNGIALMAIGFILLSYILSVEKNCYIVPGPVIGLFSVFSFGFGLVFYREGQLRREIRSLGRYEHVERDRPVYQRREVVYRGQEAQLTEFRQETGDNSWRNYQGFVSHTHDKRFDLNHLAESGGSVSRPNQLKVENRQTIRRKEIYEDKQNKVDMTKQPPFIIDVSSISSLDSYPDESIADLKKLISSNQARKVSDSKSKCETPSKSTKESPDSRGQKITLENTLESQVFLVDNTKDKYKMSHHYHTNYVSLKTKKTHNHFLDSELDTNVKQLTKRKF